MPTSVLFPTENQAKSYQHLEDQSIFVLELYSGKVVVGQAKNVAKRIASINSGHNAAIPEALQVKRIIGVKPCGKDRTLISTAKYFFEKYGVNDVLVV